MRNNADRRCGARYCTLVLFTGWPVCRVLVDNVDLSLCAQLFNSSGSLAICNNMSSVHLNLWKPAFAQCTMYSYSKLTGLRCLGVLGSRGFLWYAKWHRRPLTSANSRAGVVLVAAGACPGELYATSLGFEGFDRFRSDNPGCCKMAECSMGLATCCWCADSTANESMDFHESSYLKPRQPTVSDWIVFSNSSGNQKDGVSFLPFRSFRARRSSPLAVFLPLFIAGFHRFVPLILLLDFFSFFLFLVYIFFVLSSLISWNIDITGLAHPLPHAPLSAIVVFLISHRHGTQGGSARIGHFCRAL